MHEPKYCLFYDNHTMAACPDVGENFDAELFADRIKRCGVDYVTFHARCNQGMAYYDTDVGIKHPALKYDLFGQLAAACQSRDIALTAYLNGGISNEEGLRRREWTTLYFDGREYREERLTPYVRTMCYNTPYRDHLIAMIKEIAVKYPVAGFFIDCLAPYKCICPTCVREMKERGIDWKSEDKVEKFSEFSLQRLCRDIAAAANAINPEFLLYFNGPGYEDQIDAATYFECECLPTNPGWGYEFLPVLSHYIRTLGDKPILNMTGRFYDWGDFGGLRPRAGIEYDLLYGLANGMRPNIGGHFHPRGDINHAVFDRIEAIYGKLREYEPWFDAARNITEIGVVYPKSIHDIRFDKELRGAVRMLEELKMQFDVVSASSDWSKYQVLMLPDSVRLSGATAERVKAHLDAGRSIIASGESGLDAAGEKFVFEQEWGVKFGGENDFDPAYFAPGENFKDKLPDMPLSLYSKGVELIPLADTLVQAALIKPYYNRSWDGERAFFYNPPDKVTDKPALTVCGRVAHFSHRIFSGYNKQASVELRQWFANVLAEFLTRPILKTKNLASYCRAFVTEQPGRRIVHVLSYLPELRGDKTQMIEESAPTLDAEAALLVGNLPPRKAYLAPHSEDELDFELENGYATVKLPPFRGYAMIVFE